MSFKNIKPETFKRWSDINIKEIFSVKFVLLLSNEKIIDSTTDFSWAFIYFIYILYVL